MPVLQLNDQQFPLLAGTTRIGSGEGADVSLPADPALGVQAIIDRAGDKSMTIRRASDAAQVRVNGVLLGAEPMPVMHGDRLEIAGVNVRFADDAKGGATQFVSANEIAAMAGAKRAGTARATAASGGRVVSLVDGKEYAVPAGGLVIGRDASCDVVVPQDEVSRRHAEIAPSEQGYVVRDMSANGVFVNGTRVQGSQRLARADVVRVGTEELRFYADVLAPAPQAPVPVASPAAAAPQPAMANVTPAAAAAPVAAAEAAQASIYSAKTPLAQPAFEDPRPVLATLELLNEGSSKGTTFSLRTPLAHVGRGGHNDVRLADESVSDTHAKLQQRADGWYVVDMGSTNGTYVGGTRVAGERRLDGAPDVRFGGMKMRFAPVGGGAEVKGTRAIAAVERPRKPAAASPEVPAPASTEPVKGGVPAIVWIVVALAVAAAAFFVLKGRA